MAACVYCGDETQLYVSTNPVCIQCVDLPPKLRAVKVKLVGALREAVKRSDSAKETFTAIMSDVPSGLPRPDGAQRIHNASHELNAARHALMEAHERLTKFLEFGIVPEE